MRSDDVVLVLVVALVHRIGEHLLEDDDLDALGRAHLGLVDGDELVGRALPPVVAPALQVVARERREDEPPEDEVGGAHVVLVFGHEQARWSHRQASSSRSRFRRMPSFADSPTCLSETR
jgi:hypothetical protein